MHSSCTRNFILCHYLLSKLPTGLISLIISPFSSWNRIRKPNPHLYFLGLVSKELYLSRVKISSLFFTISLSQEMSHQSKERRYTLNSIIHGLPTLWLNINSWGAPGIIWSGFKFFCLLTEQAKELPSEHSHNIKWVHGKNEIPLSLWPQHYLTMFLSQSVYNPDVQILVARWLLPTPINWYLFLLRNTHFSITFRSI